MEINDIKVMKQRGKFSPISMPFMWKIQGLCQFGLIGEVFQQHISLGVNGLRHSAELHTRLGPTVA